MTTAPNISANINDIPALVQTMGEAALKASRVVALAPAEQKTKALLAAADAIDAQSQQILAANALDVQEAKQKGQTEAFIDRLVLTPERVAAIAESTRNIAQQDDPVGAVLEQWQQPKPSGGGLDIQKVRVPIGVIGVIFESRPNVTADAGALCIKSGNAALLRCGSESLQSSLALLNALQTGLEAEGLPKEAVQLFPTADRAAVGAMLNLNKIIDVIIPRGGYGLVKYITENSSIPVIKHLDGLCHVYIDKQADTQKALDVVVNAKLRRVGICGATETLLVHEHVASGMLPGIARALLQGGCELRGDDTAQKILDELPVTPATEEDWATEYLAPIISIKIVDSLDTAIQHVNQYGSMHTDCIVTEDAEAAKRFQQQVTSAIAMHNVSTQFADGGEFGFGAEIGISTDKLHARGPVGAQHLTTYKYMVTAAGDKAAIRA